MPAHKKHPTTRARRNKATTAATLRVVETVAYAEWTIAQLRTEIDERNLDRPDDEQIPRTGGKAKLVAALEADDAPNVPALPDREQGWHQMTRTAWVDWWSSPMSDEWHTSDIHNVYICAMLYDDMLRGDTATARTKAAAEYRQQRRSLGLSPMDRRSLEWTIETADEAKAKGERRRTGAAPSGSAAKKTAAKKDPRAGLHAVT